MNDYDVKNKLISLFDPAKLVPTGEWGFANLTGKEIKVVGYATNLTPEVIRAAAAQKVNFLLTHHDAWGFIYGLKDACTSLLKQFGIAHGFFHAPLDDAPFGTSASLARALGLINCRQAVPYEGLYMAGIIGQLPQDVSFEWLHETLSSVLGETVRGFKNNNRTIGKVCVVTGGGQMTNDMKAAVDERCDAYITGEYVLYSQLYAKHAGMNLFVGSHTYTEIQGVHSLAQRLSTDTDMTYYRIPEENY